jgi:hypothetical protein
MADEERTVYHHLLDTDDAMAWATEFVKTFDGGTVIAGDLREAQYRCATSPYIDEGRMVAWFANAIETAKRIEREKWEPSLLKITDAYIQATNPGIDMDEVRDDG